MLLAQTLLVPQNGSVGVSSEIAPPAANTLAGNSVPIGSVDSATGTQVSGWAFDADAGATPIQVRVDIDGAQGTAFTANTARADLASYLGSVNHGFTYTMPTLAVGNHQVSVYAIDSTTGTAQLLATRTVTRTGAAPIGSVDIANVTQVIGWAFDADAGATAIQVRVSVDGVAGTPVAASLARSDLAGYLGSANHGYNIALPALSLGVHTITVFAIDTPAGNAVQIGTAKIVTNYAPIGSLDVADLSQIAGWACDPSAAATAIQVRVDIDGVAGTPFTASLARPDLQNYLGSSNHGFSLALPTLSAGAHTVKVYALDNPSGAAVQIGTTRTIVNHAPIGSVDAATLTSVAGWVTDTDAGAASIRVRIDVDGTPGTPFVANVARPDLQNYLGSVNHGYSFTLPALGIGTHTIAVFALDSSSGGAAQIGTTRTVVNQAPVGTLDNYNAGLVYGWAFDANAGAASIQVRIDIDGVAGAPFVASSSRPDLQTYLHSTNHGYTFNVLISSQLPSGTHTVAAYALDSTSGAAVLLGHRTITV